MPQLRLELCYEEEKKFNEKKEKKRDILL